MLNHKVNIQGGFTPAVCGSPECYKLQTGADIITVQAKSAYGSQAHVLSFIVPESLNFIAMEQDFSRADNQG